MVLLGLGDRSDPVHKFDSRHEPLEPEDLRQAEVAIGFVHRPTLELSQQVVHLLAPEVRAAGFASDAMLLVEGRLVGGGHPGEIVSREGKMVPPKGGSTILTCSSATAQ